MKLKLTKYIPHRPTAKQLAGLVCDGPELLYGGAAGGGKSDWLLMCALQYVDVPRYAAILFRRTYSDLILPDALMFRAHQWLDNTDAHWSAEQKTWYFPTDSSPATLSFGFLESEADRLRYQGAAFQLVGFDEVTQFTQSQYTYLFSRLRRGICAMHGREHTHGCKMCAEVSRLANVPLRMRAASNPGGPGHEWVKQRFITEGAPCGHPFLAAKIDDNPHLDRAEYVKSLAMLDPVTKLQLLNGDWTARATGAMFKREWFKIQDVAPAGLHWVRRWDMAAGGGDYTAGCKMAKGTDGRYYIADVRRTQASSQAVEGLVKQCAQLDGIGTRIYIEQEPGAGGKTLVDYYVRQLAGYQVYADRPFNDKATRAAPLASQAEAKNVTLIKGAWIGAFLDELEGFPVGEHDDQVDAASGAFGQLTNPSSFEAWEKFLKDRTQKKVEGESNEIPAENTGHS